MFNSRENDARKESFKEEMGRLERMFNSRPLVPQVYIMTDQKFVSSAQHFLYDCLGFVTDVTVMSQGVLVKGVISPTKEDLFKKVIRKYQIYKEAGIQYPGKNETVKRPRMFFSLRN